MLELLKIAAAVFGLIISIPTLMLVWRASMFVGSMKITVEQTAKSLTAFTERVDRVLESHERSITEFEVKIERLWDGGDRRTGIERREKA